MRSTSISMDPVVDPPGTSAPSATVASSWPRSPVVSTWIGCRLERASTQILDRSGTIRKRLTIGPRSHPAYLQVPRDVGDRVHDDVRDPERDRGGQHP